MMTLAKGITNAAVPMGAVCARHAIYDTVVEQRPGRHRAVSRLHVFGPPARRGRRSGDARALSERRAVRARGVARVLLGRRGAFAARLAARDRPAQHRPRRRHRARAARRRAGRARVRDVPQVLRGGRARSLDGRHDRALAAAHRRTRSRSIRCSRPCRAALRNRSTIA